MKVKKGEELELLCFVTMGALLARAPPIFFNKEFDVFYQKKIERGTLPFLPSLPFLPFSSLYSLFLTFSPGLSSKELKMRNCALETINHLLSGRTVSSFKQWTPSNTFPWNPQAVTEVWASSSFPYYHAPIWDISPNRNKGMERLNMILSSLLGRKSFRERPGESTTQLISIFLHMGAHSLSFLHSKVIPSLIENDSKMNNLYIALGALKRIVQPGSAFWDVVGGAKQKQQQSTEITWSDFEEQLAGLMLSCFQLCEKDIRETNVGPGASRSVLETVSCFVCTFGTLPQIRDYTNFENKGEVNVFTEALSQQVFSCRRYRNAFLLSKEERSAESHRHAQAQETLCSSVVHKWKTTIRTGSVRRGCSPDTKLGSLKLRNMDRNSAVSESKMWSMALCREAISCVPLLTPKAFLTTFRTYFIHDSKDFIGGLLVSSNKEIAHAVSDCFQQLMWNISSMRAHLILGLLSLTESCILKDDTSLQTFLDHSLFLCDQWVALLQDPEKSGDPGPSTQEMEVLKCHAAATGLTHLCNADTSIRAACLGLIYTQDALTGLYQNSLAGLLKVESLEMQKRMRRRYLRDYNLGMSTSSGVSFESQSKELLPDLPLDVALYARGSDQIVWTYYLVEFGRLCSSLPAIRDEVIYLFIYLLL